MNANELADKLLEDLREVDLFNMDSVYYGNRKHYIDQLESVIRQQQAKIEALKQIIDANNLIQNIGQFVKPQEKCPPVSWWKGDPTCGGLTENYGLGKAQEK